jgi:hypothetical protein
MARTDRQTPDAAVADLERQAAVAQANAEIRALGDRVFPFDIVDTRFWCECGDESCHEPVLMSLRRFDELKELGDPVLADGHPDERSRSLRRHARELGGDLGGGWS